MTACHEGFDCDSMSQLAQWIRDGGKIFSVSQEGYTGSQTDLNR